MNSAQSAPTALPGKGGAPASASASAAALAKGALRRLAQAQLEPTPENYARAYADEAGLPAPAAVAEAPLVDIRTHGLAWLGLVERLARNLDRGGRQWTAARRKDSLKRVLEGSRSDTQRLVQRLQSLMTAWETDQLDDSIDTDPNPEEAMAAQRASGAAAAPDPGSWPQTVTELESAVRAALPTDSQALADRFAHWADTVALEGALPSHLERIAELCEQARRVLGQRHRLVDQLALLCQHMTAGLGELAEDDSWVKGQCDVLKSSLAQGLSLRAVRAASVVLNETRQRQQRVKLERQHAREALKQMLQDMLIEVGELGEHTGRFDLATTAHVKAIEAADSLESLTGVVKSLLEDSRTVQTAVRQSQQRLQADRQRASELESRVRELESELRRLSDEVSTDLLTQVANRRGLMQAFEAESARSERQDGTTLAVGLIDIDNFKRLNDTLGHAAGDMALKTLAQEVRQRLRPIDHLARFGGEEFVLLLPDTEVEQAQQAMTRLQRALSVALFLHEGREVFVTFSGGVTAWRTGEPLQNALERADAALYEAKRTGKNRTCLG